MAQPRLLIAPGRAPEPIGNRRRAHPGQRTHSCFGFQPQPDCALGQDRRTCKNRDTGRDSRNIESCRNEQEGQRDEMLHGINSSETIVPEAGVRVARPRNGLGLNRQVSARTIDGRGGWQSSLRVPA